LRPINGLSDTPLLDGVQANNQTRRSEAIFIDESVVVVAGHEGVRVFNFLKRRGIKNVFVVGEAANQCVLKRDFGIIALVRHGFKPFLVRDEVRPMFSPSEVPYCNYEEAAKLIVGYTERFWCPSVSSDELEK
jgi:nicotinamidase-related amidase